MKHVIGLCIEKGFWVGCLHAIMDPNVVKIECTKTTKNTKTLNSLILNFL
jgi:hypothetical protein